ncbi:MAG TPA: cupin domain-containing protein [Gemmatimonadaceae bacterium]|jgi:quercetin dioxygenase-like cupin family protein
MSSLKRTITGEVLVQHLSEDATTIDPVLVAQHGRSARTLVKEGPLRLTIMALGENGDMSPHSAAGPITIQVLQGAVTIVAVDEQYALRTGDVLVLAAGVEHAARTTTGAVFLLTVVHLPSAPLVISHPLDAGAKERWAKESGR